MNNVTKQPFDASQVVNQQSSWLMQSGKTIVDLSTGMDTAQSFKKGYSLSKAMYSQQIWCKNQPWTTMCGGTTDNGTH